jgi:hypothetical protein
LAKVIKNIKIVSILLTKKTEEEKEEEKENFVEKEQQLYLQMLQSYPDYTPLHK